MRVLVLGATGRVAAQALALLAGTAGIDDLVMAGRDAERLEQRRTELGIEASVVAVDATDAGQVEAAADGCDVVLNLAGRDDVTPIAASAGALAAGCHYVDIAASPSAVESLLARSSAFEAAGLTCVPSIGSAPGLSGMLGAHAAAQLDECHSITVNLGLPLIRWGEPASIAAAHRAGGPVLQAHATVVAWFARLAPVVREGAVAWVRPLENVQRVTAPDGRSYDMMPIASTEALTLPRASPGVTRVESLAALWPEAVMAAAAVRSADLDPEDAARELYAELAEWDPQQLRPPSTYPDLVFWGQADGVRSGRACSVRCVPAVPYSTASVASAATVLVASDPVISRGTVPPEACFELPDFLDQVCEMQHVAVDQPTVTIHVS